MARLKCPTCNRVVRYNDEAEVPDRPFCSERCRLIDLGKWFDEEYRISTPLENASEAAPPPDKGDDEAG